MFFLSIVLGLFLSTISCIIIVLVKKFTDENYGKATYDKQFTVAYIISFIAAFCICYIPGYINKEPVKKSTSYSQTVETRKSDFNEGFEKGYEKGYENGFSDGKLDSGMSVYEIINSEAFYIIKEEAERYASGEYGWSPEEACEVIICYLNREKYFDSVPTEEDYLDAVGTLIAFYDYFYNK